jgi:hypothetical protein
MNALEQFVAQLNANVFLREFSFSRLTFIPIPGQELEFADHVIWLDNVWLLYQLKARSAVDDSVDRLRSWFKRKVLGTATRQIRDTLRYLDQQQNIVLRNQRGHEFNVAAGQRSRVYKIVIYDLGPEYDQSLDFGLYHKSQTAGFIHVININNYLDICRTLITPAEIWEYLDFREQILIAHAGIANEMALLGQFLTGSPDQAPNDIFADAVPELLNDPGEFDIRFITETFLEDIYHRDASRSEFSYYNLVAELAKLDRSELKEFKRRLQRCVEDVNRDEFRLPYRMQSTRTGCGFVFVSCTSDMISSRRTALRNLTVAAKYGLSGTFRVS